MESIRERKERLQAKARTIEILAVEVHPGEWEMRDLKRGNRTVRVIRGLATAEAWLQGFQDGASRE
jgi:hypothetical protein